MVLLALLTLALPWLMGAAAAGADGEVQLHYGAGSYQAPSCGGVKRTNFEELATRVEATVAVGDDHRLGGRIDLGAVREENQFTEATADGRLRRYTTGGVLWGARPALLWHSRWAGGSVGWQWLGRSGFAALGLRAGPPRLYAYAGMLDGGLTGGFYDGLGILAAPGGAALWLSRVGVGGAWPALGLSGQIGLTSLDTRALAEVTVRGQRSWGSWTVSARLGQLDPNWQVMLGISMPLFATEAQKAAAPF